MQLIVLYIEGRRFWTNLLDVQDGLLSLRSVHALKSRFCFTSAKKTIAMDCTQDPDVSVHLSRDNLQMANRRPLLVVWPKKSSPHVMPQCLSCTPPITTHQCLSFFLLSSILIMAAFASILSVGSSTPATPRRNLQELRNADHISTR